MSKPLIRFLFLGDPRTDRRLKNFLGFFRDCRYDVDLIFATPGKAVSGECVIEGAKAKQLPLKQSGGAKMFLQYDLLVKDELRSAKLADFLFACELYSLNAAAFAIKDRRASQLIYDARELYTELPSVSKQFFKKWYWKRWERKGLKQSALVIVTAPLDADAIRQVHGFLPPSLLIRNFPKREELKPNTYLREYFSIASEKRIFVYIGGIQHYRGLDKMMNVMPALQDKAAFVMIGDGAIKNRLQSTCSEMNLGGSIFFHPSIDSEKAIEVLSSADVGVSLIEQHSKSYELALPSKIFEYMLAGLPVISSPLKQVKSLLYNNEGLLFADPDNSDELVSACKRAMTLSSDTELKTKIYADAYNHFTFEIETDALKNFLTGRLRSETRNPIS